MMTCESNEKSINVMNIHAMMNDCSVHKVRNNDELKSFFEKVLNFGENLPVRKENSFQCNGTMICFFFQQLKGVCQANMEGNHHS